MTGARQHLPVAGYREVILYLVKTHNTIVLVGETGSGKTTQVPQYLDEAGWTRDGRQVVCTQPRRMAAVTVARRVAEEQERPLGDTVGYAVRFESVMNEATTRIKYVTDGVLLQEMMDDPLLSQYSVIMVDEAHERSLATDMLLGLLKKVLKQRKDLRLIISSATLEVDRLVDFFDLSTSRSGQTDGELVRRPAVVSVEGRTHPVQVHYLLEPSSNYLQSAVECAVNIHREDVPGDVLIFLTGQEECETVTKMLREEGRRLARSNFKYKMMPLPLYAGPC